jgi:hypothetical protein
MLKSHTTHKEDMPHILTPDHNNEGYVDEKLDDAYQAGTIPVVLGSPFISMYDFNFALGLDDPSMIHIEDFPGPKAPDLTLILTPAVGSIIVWLQTHGCGCESSLGTG